MPRFYFDLDDGVYRSADEDGHEINDAEAARMELVGALTEMAKDQLADGYNRDFTGTLRDANGQARFTATLSLRSGWID